MLFDAPPSIGHNPRRAVDEIAATEGVSNKVTHLVYSHHHADHAAAASLFDDAVRVGHEETRRLLLRDNDPSRPLPEVTFADRYTLEVPESGLSSPGTAPTIRRTTSTFTSLTTTRSSTSSTPAGCLSTTPTSARMYPATSRPPATALNYPWRHFICGHLGRLATRDDVAVHQQYIADTEASAREALASVDPTPYYMRYRENVWAW